jgi:hypothetical protein
MSATPGAPSSPPEALIPVEAGQLTREAGAPLQARRTYMYVCMYVCETMGQDGGADLILEDFDASTAVGLSTSTV